MLCLGIILTVFSLSHIVRLGRLVEGTGLVVFLLITTQFNDVSQYAWGKMFGRTPLAPTLSPNKTREGMLGGLGAGLDAVRAQGARIDRVLLIGGAAASPAVQAIAAQVFDVPVEMPSPGEYVADGAARQAAGVLGGAFPDWPVELIGAPVPDLRPEISEQYAAAASRYL